MKVNLPIIIVWCLYDSQKKALCMKLLEILVISHLSMNFIHIHILLNFQATKHEDELNWALSSLLARYSRAHTSPFVFKVLGCLLFQRTPHFHMETERVSITNFSRIDSTVTPQAHTYAHTWMHTHLYSRQFACNLKGELS